ncbi:MAG: putative hemolysin [Thermodesulfobacteriota bacterium]
MIKKLILILLLIFVITGFNSCKQKKDEVKLANPASVFCAENGGKTSIRIENYGDVGYCLFNDGTQCEEWAYFRGECRSGEFKTTDYE